MTTAVPQIRTSVDSARFYGCPDGAFPSVTSILAASENAQSRARLKDWVAANPHDRSAERGTVVHKIVEGWLKSPSPQWGSGKIPATVLQDEKGMPLSLKQSFKVMSEIEEWHEWIEPLQDILPMIHSPVWAEGPLRECDRHTIGEDGHARVWSTSMGYAGCPDIIAEYRGALSLIDIKTATNEYQRFSSRYPGKNADDDALTQYRKAYGGYKKYEKVRLQLVAYRQAIKETLGLEIDKLVAVVVVPGKVSSLTLSSEEILQAENDWREKVEHYYAIQSKET